MADDSISPTPRSSGLGALADALAWAKSAANNVDIGEAAKGIPFVGGALGSILQGTKLGNVTLGQAPEEVNRWAYGNSPLAWQGNVPVPATTLPVDEVGNRIPGDNTPHNRALDVADLGMAAQTGLPVLKAAGRGVAAGAGALGDKAVQAITSNPQASALGVLQAAALRDSPALAAAVRSKGGNFDKSSLDEYLERFEGSEHPATDAWSNTQLRNYLSKDLGAPTDPLLAVEKDLPDVHMPPDTLPIADEMRLPGMLGKHVTGPHAQYSPGVPLTPWGLHSGQTVQTRTVGDYLAEGDTLPWMFKPGLDPATPVYSLKPDADLGFGHVIDYLDAAQRAHAGHDPAMLNAGLALSPDQVSKTSVADASRKAAAWSEFLRNPPNPVNDPNLNSAITTHKEYPDGMKWVKIDATPKNYTLDTLPEGWALKDIGSNDPVGRAQYQLDHPEIQGFGGSTPQAALDHMNKGLAKDELTKGLNAEGAAMGHCVGGYCDDVASRGTQIYSLRDANNQPHVTVEVSPPRGNMDDYTVNGKAYPVIQQIKGKQNAAPVAKYQPYVQDFVKSGQWGDVRDLQNSGLRDLQQLYKPDYAKQLQDVLGARYVTDADIDSATAQLKPQGFAHGGSVVPKYSKKAALLARLNRPR